MTSNARAARRGRLLATAFPPFSRTLLSIAAAASVAGLAPAFAGPNLPTGGSVASGTATIGAPSNGSLTITQSSDRAIINWQGFSIGQTNAVTFNNGAGATLNRVTGTAQSNIDGALSATGSVYLLNPNGIVVGPTGTVNVGKNFVASTLGASDDAFNAGGALTLSGTGTGAVVNEGKIGSLGGDVALVARNVANTGTIAAPNGSAGLLAGTQVTLRDTTLDDGKFSVDLGTASDVARNTGTIAAAEAELKANGGNVYALAGNTRGVISATGVSSNDGKVLLTAGDNGSVTTNADISAQTSSGTGGTVDTSAGTVNFDGLHVLAGEWIVDPINLNIDSAAAATIATNLATTNVTIKTTATGTDSSINAGTIVPPGRGDITVNAPISWSTSNALTFSAYRNVSINANIVSTGGGNVTLITDNTGIGAGRVLFGVPNLITTSGTVSLYYNPSSYTTPTNYAGHMNGGATFIPYMLVNTLDELQAINTNTSADYALGRDIDASATSGWNAGAGFVPVKAANFDGQGHTISNLFINLPSQDGVGLFSTFSNKVQNLTIANANITGQQNVGVLAGSASSGTIDAVSVSGSVSGTNFVGGLIGNASGTVTNSSAAASVTGSGSDIGGLAGANYGTISSSNASGTVTGSYIVGGLVGYNKGTVAFVTASGDVTGTGSAASGPGDVGGLIGQNQSTDFKRQTGNVSFALASGNVTGTWDVGGAIGFNYGGAVDHVGATGTVIGQVFVGGLIGEFAGTVGGNLPPTYAGNLTNSFATGAVTATQFYAGGLIGTQDGFSTASNDWASGAVTAPNVVGGFVGFLQNIGILRNNPAISDSYALGSVTSTSGNAGAFVGILQGYITNVYASGLVTAATTAGGLVGDGSSNQGNVTNSYWDSFTTGQTSAGTGFISATTAVSANTGTAYTQASYLNFDFTPGTGAWYMIDGQTRPFLQGETWSTSAGNYLIANVHQLQLMAMAPTAHYSMISGIDVDASATAASASAPSANMWTGAGFVPVSSPSGTFDGEGPAISNLFINRPTTDDVGLFTSVGSVSGLNLANADIIGHDDVGIVVGLMQSGVINNVEVSGIVNGANDVGGIAGAVVTTTSAKPQILNSSADVAVTATTYEVGGVAGRYGDANQVGDMIGDTSAGSVNGWGLVGGLVGALGFANVVSSSSSSTVTGQGGPAGGLVGTQSAQGNIMQSSASGAVSSDAETGGLVGYNFGGTISQSSAASATNIVSGSQFTGGLVGVNLGIIDGSNAAITIKATDNDSGGLVGQNYGSITNSTASGTVFGGNDNIGGLVGENDGSIANSSAIGEVMGQGGGAVGLNAASGTISFVRASGNVTGPGIGGGLVAENRGDIDHSAATGNVVGIVDVGGFAGLNEDNGSISDSYATGSVTAGNASVGGTRTGGLVGDNFGGTITESWSASAVTLVTANDNTVTAQAGGLVGTNDKNTSFTGNISYSYALGPVTATGADVVIGGIVGENSGSITQAYATGVLSASSGTITGGLVGIADTSSSASNAYWDTATTGVASAIGTSNPGSTATNLLSVSATNNSAYLQTAYANFDFTSGTGHWYMINGQTRPFLQSEVWADGSTDLITNAHQLQLMTLHPSADYTLGNNIDLLATQGAQDIWTGVGFVPIANFSGTLDGQDHTLTNLFENRPGLSAQGLFRTVTASGVVENLTLWHPSVTGLNNSGAVVGQNSGTLANVTVSGGQVTGARYIGGIAGANLAGGSITDSSTSAAVIATADRIGGLVGWNQGFLSADSSSGHTIGTDQVGGLAGWNDGAITHSSASGETTGSGYGVGGLVGYNTILGSLTEVDATGTVDGAGGGLGGLVGYNLGSVTNAYATGTVGLPTTHTVGGLIGNNGGALTDVYAAAIVHGATSATGALIGADTSSSITNAYYDTFVTGAMPSIGNNYAPGVDPHPMNASHPPTSQSTYVGFDFSAIWMIAPGQLPTLQGVP